MYDYVDRRLNSLDTGSRFLVRSMRQWVQLMAQARCPRTALEPVFARRGMSAALPDFHMAMILLNRDAKETLRFAPLHCAHACEDEAVLLSLARLLLDGRREAADGLFALLVVEEAVFALSRALSTVSAQIWARSADDDDRVSGKGLIGK